MRQKTFRLFVSSTFKDFQQERKVLNEVVAPKLQSYCEAYGYAFELIDLRWGVSDEASANQLTLRICINEILRCKRYSPKPHFLLMLGGRYGSIPLPGELAPDVFEAVTGALGDGSRLMEHWYVFDDNIVGGAYVLRTRDGEFREYSNWSPVKNDLLAAFSRAIEVGPGWLSDSLRIISTTEHEFEAGLIDNDMARGAVVFLRGGDAVDEAPAQGLRFRAASLMEEKHLESHVFELNGSTDDYLERFETRALAQLVSLIDDEVRSLDSDSALEPHYDGSAFVGRTVELVRLNSYLHSDERVPLLVRGVSGSGKSTLLSRFVEQCSCSCVYVSYGRAEGLFTMSGAIREVCRQLRMLQGSGDAPPVNSFNAGEVLWDELVRIEGDLTLVVIDGLEGLMEWEPVRSNVLPQALPQGVKLVVSCTDESADKLLGEGFGVTVHMDNLASDDALALVDERLGEAGRRIAPSGQRKALRDFFAGGTTPLQASLVSNLSMRWRSSIAELDLPGTSEDAALSYIEAAYSRLGHGKALTLYALAFVCEAPFGIAEQELLELLPKVNEVSDEFDAQDRYRYSGSRLPYVVWSRLYYDLRDCLETVMFKGVPVIRFEHSVFYRVMRGRYGDLCKTAQRLLCDDYLAGDAAVGTPSETRRVMKTTNLPALLRLMGRNAELAELLCSAEFLDSMMRVGDYDVAVSLFSELLDESDPSPARDRLLKSLSQLRVHRGSLTCYTRSLPIALSGGLGLTVEEGLRLAQNALGEPGSAFTPIAYSSSSKLCWSPDGSLCAVWHNANIYVCDESWSEISRVAVRDDTGGLSPLAALGWLSCGVVAVATANGDVLAYRVDVKVPTVVASAKVMSKPLGLLLSPPCKAVAVVMSDCVSVLDNVALKERFSAHLGKDGTASLSYDLSSLVVHDGKGTVELWSMVSGEITKLIRCKKVDDSPIRGMLSDGSLVFSCFPTGLAIVSADGSARRYVYPPRAEDVLQSFLSDNTAVFSFEDGVYAADLLTGTSAACQDISGVRGVFPGPRANTVTVVTDLGTQDVSLADGDQISGAPPLFQSNAAVGSGNQLSTFVRAMWLLARIELALHSSRGWALLGLNSISASVKGDGSVFALLNGRAPGIMAKPTLVSQSPAGVTAVAYELSDAIVVYDSQWSRQLLVDRLRFSAFDPLLHMRLSNDGSMLLVHRTTAVSVYGVGDGNRLLEVPLDGDVVRDAWFGEGSEIVVLDCDGKQYHHRIGTGGTSAGGLSGPRLGSDEIAVVAIPGFASSVGSAGGHPAISESDALVSVRKGFEVSCSDVVLYKGDGQSILFDGETFYLGSDRSRPFLSRDCDFGRCLAEERQRPTSQVELFVREKNDLSSSIHSVGKSLLLLVSMRLSSVIVFDAEAMTVREAYRHRSQIIGSLLDRDSSTLTLFSDVAPFSTTLRLVVS